MGGNFTMYPDIYLQLRAIKGDYIIYISNKNRENIDKYHLWNSENNLVSISGEDPDYPKNGLFYGVVIMKHSQEFNNRAEE